MRTFVKKAVRESTVLVFYMTDKTLKFINNNIAIAIQCCCGTPVSYRWLRHGFIYSNSESHPAYLASLVKNLVISTLG